MPTPIDLEATLVAAEQAAQSFNVTMLAERLGDICMALAGGQAAPERLAERLDAITDLVDDEENGDMHDGWEDTCSAEN